MLLLRLLLLLLLVLQQLSGMGAAFFGVGIRKERPSGLGQAGCCNGAVGDDELELAGGTSAIEDVQTSLKHLMNNAMPLALKCLCAVLHRSALCI